MSKFEAKTIMRCKVCGDVFWSTFPGDFVTCTCFKDCVRGESGCGVDETEHYCRWIGSNFEIQAKEDGTHIKKGEWYDPIKDLAESQIN